MGSTSAPPRRSLAPVLTRAALVALLGLTARAAAPSALAAQADLSAADEQVASWVAQGRIPGAVLLVTQDGQVVWEKAYGWRQRWVFGSGEYGRVGKDRMIPGVLEALAAPPPMTAPTVFDLASVTKVMATTFAVMLLVDRGAVDLDVPVTTYLPDFTGGGKESITVRHLLTHRSGMAQWWPVYAHAAGADDAYAFVRDLPLSWPVGEGRHYSDLGFMVLGRVVEAVAGRPLDRFLAEELYAPLGLEATGFRPAGSGAGEGRGGPYAATSHGNPYEYRMVRDTTFGYRIPGGAVAWDGWRRRTLSGEVNDGNAWHAFGGVAGHAGLFSTARELAALTQLLLDGGVHQGRRVVAKETVAAFLADQGDAQALGWQRPAYAPPGSFAHTGFTGTWVLGVPSQGLAVVLLTNRQNVGVDAATLYPDVGPLQRGVAEAVLGTWGRGPG